MEMEVIEERQESPFLSPEEAEAQSTSIDANHAILSYTFTFDSDLDRLNATNLLSSGQDDASTGVEQSNKEIQLLYSKTHAAIFEQNSVPEGSSRNEESDTQIIPKRMGLTHVEEYRAYMEAALMTKVCLLGSVIELQSAVHILYRKTSILEDPACGEISVWKAWFWMIEESLTLTGKNVTSKEKKKWKEFVTQNLQALLQSCKMLQTRIQKLEETFSKLQLQFNSLEKRSKTKFSDNIHGAELQWKSTDKILMEQDLRHVQKKVEWLQPKKLKDGKEMLKVRWDLNGVMFRIGGKTQTQWFKLNSVKLLQDKKVLIKHFISAAQDFMSRADLKMKNTGEFWVREEGRNNEGCVSTLLKKQMRILTRTMKLFPREEAQMHCCSIRNAAIFESVYPTLQNMKGRVDKYVDFCEDLVSRAKAIGKGNGRRMPLDRWSQLNLELEADGYLKEICLRNKGKGDITNSNVDDSPSNTRRNSMTVINHPNSNFGPQQKQSSPDVDLKDESMPRENVEADLSFVNGSVQNTCFLFGDERGQYRKLGRCLLKGKPLDEKDVFLCRDSVKCVYELVIATEQTVEGAKKFVSDGLGHLIFGNTMSAPRSTKNIFWLQLLHRSIEVWDTYSIEPRYKRKFAIANCQLLEKTHALELAISNLMQLFLKYQQDLSFLETALKMFPDIVRLRESFPVRVSATDFHLPENSNDSQDSNKEALIIKFVDSDMEFTIRRIENGELTEERILLNDLPMQIQADIICIPIFQQIKTINKVIVYLTAAEKALAELKICDIWETIVPSSLQTPSFKTMENIVLAVLISRANGSLYSLSPLLLSAECNIGNFNSLVQLLQMHCMAKKLIDGDAGSLDDMDKSRLLVLQRAFEDIPNQFEISDAPIAREYLQLLNQARGPRTSKSKVQSTSSSFTTTN